MGVDNTGGVKVNVCIAMGVCRSVEVDVCMLWVYTEVLTWMYA